MPPAAPQVALRFQKQVHGRAAHAGWATARPRALETQLGTVQSARALGAQQRVFPQSCGAVTVQLGCEGAQQRRRKMTQT
jgi:hypothetical protein